VLGDIEPVCFHVSAYDVFQASFHANWIGRVANSQPTRSPNSLHFAAHRACKCRRRTNPQVLLFGATALQTGWVAGRAAPLSRAWAFATPLSPVVCGRSICVVLFSVVYRVRCEGKASARSLPRWRWMDQSAWSGARMCDEQAQTSSLHQMKRVFL
jgi:hypothetical protein